LKTPVLDFLFPRNWEMRVLPARPLILPPRHYVYPRDAEEVERGALELMISPKTQSTGEGTLGRPAPNLHAASLPFLATCALGFNDPAAPTGVWSTPDPDRICAVSGGYAYIIDTLAPEQFTMIPYRPVLAVVPAVSAGLLLFVGHRAMVAWGNDGQAWESEKLSDEGITVEATVGSILHGRGWHLMTDRETPFLLDLRTGRLM
jgi:hypothetical protein